ncbi:MAG: preprotein translocase subunit SecG [Planctomycetaceae bacterium]|nr:preprotein translocase subunit SecG [Planctomycetaceae bacterium]
MKTIALLTQLLLMFLGIFLMIIVLLQRGRGGGLAGAFGGMGGQSAFGTKAGDVFTRITVVVAIAWVLVAGGSGYFLRAASESRSRALTGPPGITAPELDAETESPDTSTGGAGAGTSGEPASDASGGTEQ